MKPQKELTFAIALSFLSQNLFFPIGVQADTMPVQSNASQQIANTVGGIVSQIPAMYSQAPNAPNLSTSNLNSQMSACATKGALGLSGSSNADQAALQKWADKLGVKKTDTAAKGSYTCKSDCTAEVAAIGTEPNCSDYAYSGSETHSTGNDAGGTDGSSGKRAKTTRDAFDATTKAQRETIDGAIACLTFQRDNCPSPDLVTLQQQMATFNCQAQALQTQIASMSGALAYSLNQNQKTFGQMNQYQKELGEQMQQVDEILGPDPELSKSGSSETMGLLGFQKQLKDAIPQMAEADTGFKADILKLKNDAITNEQNLEATRVNIASSCIKGSRDVGVTGGYSLTCFKPVQVTAKDGTVTNAVDRNGNTRFSKQSCGPYDYIRSKIQQKALLNSKGQIMNQEESRRETSADNATQFDGLVDTINRAMGDYDQKNSDGSRMDVDVHSWADIEAKVSSNIDAVASQSGVDIRSMLEAIGSHCFQEADAQKAKLMRSPGSDYSKKKAELQTTQTNLTSKIDSGLSALSSTYKDVMSLMFNKATPIDRSLCTKDNPDKMESCYTQMQTNIQNLLDGTGNNTLTAKTIKGGPLTPPFVVPCKGINGCVTALINVRNSQKETIRARQKDKESFVNQSNQTVQNQLQGLGSQLGSMQSSLINQFNSMKATMMKMGVDMPDRPNSIEAEALQPSEGPPPDKTPGPFMPPKNISAVLSGIMPGGLINFADLGIRDSLKELAKKDQDRKDTVNDSIKKYQEEKVLFSSSKIVNSCDIAYWGEDKNTSSKEDDFASAVNNMEQSCGDAADRANSCANALNATTKVSDDGFLAKAAAVEIQIEELSKDKKKNQAKIDQLKKKDEEYMSKAKPDTITSTTPNYSSENMQILQTLADIFNKMSMDSSDKSAASDYNQIKDGKLFGALSSLSENKSCADLSSFARKCRTAGKGFYTEGSHGSTPAANSANTNSDP